MNNPLRSIPCYLALALFTSSVFAESGEELIAKVKAKYASCESFKCEGENKVTSNMMGKDKAFKSERKFSILFKRPDLLRVDWIDPSMNSFTPTRSSLYTENGKYYGHSRISGTPQEFPSLEMGMGTFAGISGGNTYFLPSLLLGKPGYLTEGSYELLPDAEHDGKPCSVVKIDDKRTGTWTLTIDKETLAILRAQQVQTITTEQSKATREEVLKVMKDKNVPLPPLPEHDYTIETDTTYRNVEFDPSLTPEDFVFHDG
jgi:hypothetical protein